MREDAATKARRLLGEGRLTLRVLEEDEIVATVRGDSARIHTVHWDSDGWSDDCDAVGKCSHIRALQLVVLEPIRGPR